MSRVMLARIPKDEVDVDQPYRSYSPPMLVSTILNLSTLSNCNGLFHSLFWSDLKWSVGVKGLQMMTACFI